MSQTVEEAILRPGDCLGGRYVIIEEIGRGGFGMVYRAVQQGINRHVAIKTLRKNSAVIPGFDFVEAFQREALHTSQLKHPNTITVFDYGESEDGNLFLVMEFLEGETLYERLWRDRIMSPQTAIHITKQIAKSLAEAHNNGIIHGDLKPANIFLCNLYGERDFVKVLDFGIAKLIGEVDPAGMGTPEYMSPEQFSGQPLLAASDIYSLGLILFEMVMGRRPYDDEDTLKLAKKQLMEALPPMAAAVEQSPLGFLIRKATAKEPAHRYEDGWTLYQALENLNRPAEPPPPRMSRALRPSSGELAQSHGMAPNQKPTEPSDPAVRQLRASLDAEGLKKLRPSESRLMRQESPPIFGRDAEQAWLLDRIAEVTDARRPSLIVMGGAAGVGKTRLAQWLVQEASIPEHVLAGTGAQRDGSPFALEGFRHALAYALGLPHHDFSARAARKIHERVQSLLGSPLASEIEDAIDTLYGPFGVDGAMVEVGQVTRLVLAIAEKHPMVLHVDNIQSADSSTLELLEELAAQFSRRPCPILLLCTVRREALPAVPEVARRLVQLVRSRQAVARTLEALEAEASVALTRHLLRRELGALESQSTPSEAMVQGVVQRSHGNPLYITELARHLIDAEAFDVTGGVAELRSDVALERLIPPRIGGLLRLRVAQLPHRHSNGALLEHVILRAALLGRIVPYDVLEELLQQEATQGSTSARDAQRQLRSLVAILAQEDLLLPVRQETPGGLEESLRFAQPLVQQILEERIQRTPEASELNRLAARAKRRYLQQGGLLEAAQEQIAQHYQHAEATEEAVDFFIEAAEATTRKRDISEALRWLERARDATGESPAGQRKRLAVLLDMAYFHSWIGGYVDLEATRVLAGRLAEELNVPSARAELHYLSGMLAYHRGHIDRAEEQFEQAIAFFLELSALKLPLAPEHQEMDLRLLQLKLDVLPPSIGLALSRLGLAWTRAVRSRFRSAQELAEAALASMEEVGFRWGQAFALQRLGELHALCGQLEVGRRQLAQARDLYLRTLPSLDSCLVQLTLCELDLLSGQTLPTLRALEEVEVSLRAQPHPPCDANRRRLQGRAAALQGDLAQARELYMESLELTVPNALWESQLVLLIEVAAFFCGTGQPQEAAQLVQKAVDLLNGDALSVFIPALQLLHGQIARAMELDGPAMSWYQAALEVAEGLDQPLLRIRALSLQAAALAKLHPDQAHPRLEEAEAIASRVRVVLPELNVARERLAMAWLSQGERAIALPMLQAAAAQWFKLGNTPEAARLQQQLPPSSSLTGSHL